MDRVGEAGQISDEYYKLVGKQLFTSDAIAVVMINKKGFILNVNSVFETWIEIPRQDLIGKPIIEVVENTRLHLVAQSGIPEMKQVQQVAGKTIIVDRLPLVSETGEKTGALGVVAFTSYDEVIRLVAEVEDQRQKIRKYEQEIKTAKKANNNFSNIIGASQTLKRAKEEARKAAAIDVDLLLLGESGTGKELFARAIYNAGSRRDEPFISINCSAIPVNLAEAELFGYESGAFTGANKGGKKGKFELAHKGTIFLDEIGDMPIELQPKLLRVLQEREVERISGSKPVVLDIRVILATNRNLFDLIKQGKFREDLYYRISPYIVEIPPLRQRKEDIPLIMESIIPLTCHEYEKSVKTFSKDSFKQIMDYDWPGNVRELLNIVRKAVITSDSKDKFLEVGNLVNDNNLLGDCVEREVYSIEAKNVKELERNMLLNALKEAKGNKARVARILGIDRSTVYRKILKYNLE